MPSSVIDKPKVSEEVRSAVKNLYATLATAAAQRALAKVTHNDDAVAAEKWAGVAAGWLVKAGARATEWKFRLPEVPR
jgi:hypothetical protein